MRERIASRLQALATKLDRPGYPFVVHLLDCLTGFMRAGTWAW
jgi:hypothetical protein